MAVKKFNPVSPGMRYRVGHSFQGLTDTKPEKSLLAKYYKKGGRNHDGKMTVRYRGGGHKRRYRVIDFKRDKDNIPATVKTIEYDPNRSAWISLLSYADGEKRYILAPQGIEVGDTVISGEKATTNIGNAMFLGDIPFGTVIHALELRPGKGAAIARSAGTSAQVLGREGKYTSVKMPSTEVRRVLNPCKATLGTTSNPDHDLQILGKAGRKRWLGRRPRTRGVAMNPVDHPMGGGEGRASGGHPRSRKGLRNKGLKTRPPKKWSNRVIVSRRKKKRKSKK